MRVPQTHWQVIHLKSGERLIQIKCASCGLWGDLEDHCVDASGKVIPSVICPNCDRHDDMQFDGWGSYCCEEWRSGIAALDSVVMLASIHGSVYSGALFRFCPWCGRRQKKEA